MQAKCQLFKPGSNSLHFPAPGRPSRCTTVWPMAVRFLNNLTLAWPLLASRFACVVSGQGFTGCDCEYCRYWKMIIDMCADTCVPNYIEPPIHPYSNLSFVLHHHRHSFISHSFPGRTCLCLSLCIILPTTVIHLATAAPSSLHESSCFRSCRSLLLGTLKSPSFRLI